MIYLDNAATTKIDPEVFECMKEWLTDEYGNPSAQYSMGVRAKNAIENARETIAKCINAEPENIYFTSGGSESDNWILKGFNHIITSTIEHHAILNSESTLRKYKYIDVDKNGYIKYDIFKNYVNSMLGFNNSIVSIMLVNNEIGTIQDLSLLCNICKERNIKFHTDAVQAFGHIPIDVKSMGIDALSASAHKFHGPKGIGFLYAKGIDLAPLICGGNQEFKLRAGTENVAGIVGMARAAEIAIRDMEENNRRINRIRNILYGEITNKIPEAHLNGTADWRKRVPGNLNFRFDGVSGEVIVEWLNSKDIFVSSGSACMSGTGEPSHVLKAIGLTPEQASSSVRFSIGKFNNEKEVPQVVEAIRFLLDTVSKYHEAFHPLIN